MVSSQGPSPKIRGEHISRVLHKIAYNAIAHDYGGRTAVGAYRHVRDYVVDFEKHRPRAVLMTTQLTETQIADGRGGPIGYSFFPGGDAPPELLSLSLGVMRFVVAVTRQLDGLQEWRQGEPDLEVVAGYLD